MKGRHTVVWILALLFLVFGSVSVYAGEVNFGEDHVPSVDEVVSALKPDDTQQLKLRGINYKPEPKMVSIQLQFEKGSFELSEQTKSSLAALGKALNSEDLKNVSFVLEGHADATGSEEYNLNLSRKRAESVKTFLVNSQKVDPGKLKAVGKGEHDPLDSADPYSMKNRRVRVVTNP